MAVIDQPAEPGLANEIGPTRAPDGPVWQAIASAEELCSWSPAALLALYRSSPAPASVRQLEGHPAGVGLALIRFRGGRLETWLRRYAASEHFPWHGKSFVTVADDEGWGYNRLAKGPFLHSFPFHTSIGPSLIDGRPAFLIDYADTRNPWWERRTWDELREVGPGVFAGVMGLRLFGRYRPLAWFACDTNRPAPMVGVRGRTARSTR